ncbi:NapC/NirT family cytochrome c [Halieaceae bacterium]|nr:NapC/NirT family cytochrome c [Halieaceae bacterium]
MRLYSAGLRLVICLAALAGLGISVNAEESPGAACLVCHDFGQDSPVHPMLEGPHGSSNPGSPMNADGCQSCHGASTGHMQAPTRNSPTVSFGPRWTASSAQQDGACLDCHEDNVAKHWQDALHMVHNVTCVTCHDAHKLQVKQSGAAGQMELCGTCHKAQQSGIHGLQEMAAFNPACTTCHNPHDDGGPVSKMLDNRSEGCRSCHDLVRMASSEKTSDKANSYHKVMVQQDRTCLDCHQGVAHAAPDSAPPLIPVPEKSRKVTLFFPGQADSEWLISNHPGSQPLRQGSGCQQCHRGEEADLGAARAGEFAPASRDIDVNFGRDGDTLQLTLSWEGDALDRDIALMWSDGSNEAMRRASCFAACHSDMPGMSRDYGQQVEKYLWVSRSQQREIGQPALVKPRDELDALMSEGNFAELWRITLGGEPAFDAGTVLEKLNWMPDSQLEGNAQFADGRWTVSLRRPLDGRSGSIRFLDEGKYTLGIALHGQSNPGGRHWVSLPLSLSLSGNETDFRVE